MAPKVSWDYRVPLDGFGFMAKVWWEAQAVETSNKPLPQTTTGFIHVYWWWHEECPYLACHFFSPQHILPKFLNQHHRRCL